MKIANSIVWVSLVSLFALYVLVWWRTSGLAAPRHWVALVLGFGIFIGLNWLLWQPVGSRRATGLGLVIYLLGILTTGCARVSLGGMWSVQRPSEQRLNDQFELVRSGPYRWVRHPIYLGLMLVFLGAFLIYWTWACLVFSGLALIGLPFRARQEEEVLERHFGTRWRRYREEVPAFLPFRIPSRVAKSNT
ncbi:MAG: isoprenylcysteine carboxylmethyltransferase family protein [Acidobacteria bacterium]|nr:isoprenylcysteine carboxylmethyltransferase family protein [Acidobacteriota bacterium]